MASISVSPRVATPQWQIETDTSSSVVWPRQNGVKPFSVKCCFRTDTAKWESPDRARPDIARPDLDRIE
jgi:hypothetical protein